MLWGTKLLEATTLFVASSGLVLGMSSAVLGEEPGSTESEAHSVHQVASSPEKFNNWVEKLKGQTIVEDSIEGRPDRAAKVDLQHERLMTKPTCSVPEPMVPTIRCPCCTNMAPAVRIICWLPTVKLSRSQARSGGVRPMPLKNITIFRRSMWKSP